MQPFGNSRCTPRLKPHFFSEIQCLSPVSTTRLTFLRRWSLLERGGLLLIPGLAPARQLPKNRDFGTHEVKCPLLFTVLPGLNVYKPGWATNLAYLLSGSPQSCHWLAFASTGRCAF